MADLAFTPFSALSCEGLKSYFNVLVDARNAVELRRSAVVADIGDCLKLLDSKLCLYSKDDVFLTSAACEIQLIQEESSARDFRINFFGLEYLRSLNPSYGLSFVEKHSSVYSSIQLVLRTKEDAERATYQFLADPSSLTERRLSLFTTLQR